jgi:hypothetical protein
MLCITISVMFVLFVGARFLPKRNQEEENISDDANDPDTIEGEDIADGSSNDFEFNGNDDDSAFNAGGQMKQQLNHLKMSMMWNSSFGNYLKRKVIVYYYPMTLCYVVVEILMIL